MRRIRASIAEDKKKLNNRELIWIQSTRYRCCCKCVPSIISEVTCDRCDIYEMMMRTTDGVCQASIEVGKGGLPAPRNVFRPGILFFFFHLLHIHCSQPTTNQRYFEIWFIFVRFVLVISAGFDYFFFIVPLFCNNTLVCVVYVCVDIRKLNSLADDKIN